MVESSSTIGSKGSISVNGGKIMADLRRWMFFAALAAAIGVVGHVEAVQVLGTGTTALLGNDLTDPENDGVESLYAPPADFGGFEATFFSSDEPGFEGAEAAFNVFDNMLGEGNAKWCCGTAFPQIVGADFRETQPGKAFRLTHFTVSSANDAPERDPVIWQIEGSLDGVCWTTIFSPSDLDAAVAALGGTPGTSIWGTIRYQVIRFEEETDYPAQDTAYSMFRMVTIQTGTIVTAFFQVGEIEFFGEEAEPPAEPPQCTSCTSAVTDVICQGGAGQDFVVSWAANPCNCADPTSILVNGVEFGTAGSDETSYTIPAASVPNYVFVVSVVNCSGLSATCTVFKTAPDGSISANLWLALGPFATSVGCDVNALLFTTNHIGPLESIGCQYPAEGDAVEGYVPGDPLFPDPFNTASTTSYHPLAPTDGSGNPVWRLFTDATPWDGDLNFEQGPAGAVDQHVQFVATWVENKSGAPLDLQACFGTDDDGQVWVDDRLVHNTASCSGRTVCEERLNFILPPGVHVITAGVWEEGGDWGMIFGLIDPATGLPIVDPGFLDPDNLLNASPLSRDIVFLGTERPADFVVPEDCSSVICPPVTALTCTKDNDGIIDLSWANPEECDSDIKIYVGKELAGTVPTGTTSFRIDDDAFRLATMVSVDNGSYSGTSCTLVEALLGLVGGDLTDLGDDGVKALYAPPGDWGGFDATFFSSDESAFGIGEAAFNVFDNIAGATDNKWCCGTSFPQYVGADFRDTLGAEYRLTYFTVASGNDYPDRDPRVWRIEGSRDGGNWTTIFSQDNSRASLWTARLQVLLFQEGREFEAQTETYSMFRMITDQTNLPGGNPLAAFFQISEIEFFGEEGMTTPEICDNGIDDDGDKLVDCADPYCVGNTACPEICDNGVDDDGDKLVDCADPSCDGNVACPKSGFRRGDADGSGKLDLTDAIATLQFLYMGYTAPECKDAADTDDSGVLDLTDAIASLQFQFMGGTAPASPGPTACGPDPTPGDQYTECTYTKC
jgi:hypothetical protein